SVKGILGYVITAPTAVQNEFDETLSVVTHPHSHIRQLWSSTFGQRQTDKSRNMASPEEIQRHDPSTDFSSSDSSYHDPSPNPSYGDTGKRKTSEKRYATYELNWNSSSAENNSTDDEFVDTEDHNSQ
ncbi:5005_t:CDS:2, partial [Acaulospora morrowiae]